MLGRLKLSGIHIESLSCMLMGLICQKLQTVLQYFEFLETLVKTFFFLLQISTNVPQVTSVTAVRHVIILMDPTRAHVTAASRGMDEPVEV